jgi:hypothetical protein
MFCARKGFTELDDAKQLRIQRVIAISSIKAVITVRPTGDETNNAELTKLVLHSVKSEAAHAHELAHVALL